MLCLHSGLTSGYVTDLIACPSVLITHHSYTPDYYLAEGQVCNTLGYYRDRLSKITAIEFHIYLETNGQV